MNERFLWLFNTKTISMKNDMWDLWCTKSHRKNALEIYSVNICKIFVYSLIYALLIIVINNICLWLSICICTTSNVLGDVVENVRALLLCTKCVECVFVFGACSALGHVSARHVHSACVLYIFVYNICMCAADAFCMGGATFAANGVVAAHMFWGDARDALRRAMHFFRASDDVGDAAHW